MKQHKLRYQTNSVLPKKQRGVTFWGFVWGAAFFICAILLAVKAVPPYMNNYKINAALNELTEEREVMTMGKNALLNKLKRRLNIDYADTYVNLNKAFKVKQLKGKRQMTINYEVVIKMVSNAYLLLDFKNEVIVTRNPGEG